MLVAELRPTSFMLREQAPFVAEQTVQAIQFHKPKPCCVALFDKNMPSSPSMSLTIAFVQIILFGY